jgi:hypothetical protein
MSRENRKERARRSRQERRDVTLTKGKRVKLTNLEQILVQRYGSAKAWYEAACKRETGGFTIPYASTNVDMGNAKEPLLTLEVMPQTDGSLLMRVYMREHILTMKAKCTDAGNLDFFPSSYSTFKDDKVISGTAVAEKWAQEEMDKILGENGATKTFVRDLPANQQW